MKTYFIDKIENESVNVIVESLSELALEVVKRAPGNSSLQRLYVHCSSVVTITKKGWQCDEQNVEYIVTLDNRKKKLYAKRV